MQRKQFRRFPLLIRRDAQSAQPRPRALKQRRVSSGAQASQPFFHREQDVAGGLFYRATPPRQRIFTPPHFKQRRRVIMLPSVITALSRPPVPLKRNFWITRRMPSLLGKSPDEVHRLCVPTVSRAAKKKQCLLKVCRTTKTPHGHDSEVVTPPKITQIRRSPVAADRFGKVNRATPAEMMAPAQHVVRRSIPCACGDGVPLPSLFGISWAVLIA